MALRRHISGMLKFSKILNNIAAERSAHSNVEIIQKLTSLKNNQVTQEALSFSLKYPSRPPTRICVGLTSLNSDVLQMSESESTSREYQCPSRLNQKFSEMIILDKQTNKSDYHLPLATNVITSCVDPVLQNNIAEIKDPSSLHTPAKEAKIIMRIRHKKMKKHKLKKLRKRMYFLWRKQKMTRKAKRDTIYWKGIADIKKEGEDFDAETFVKSQLVNARRGGFYINVFDSKA